MEWFQCFNCRKLTPISPVQIKCPDCGSKNGEIVSSEEIEKKLGRLTGHSGKPKVPPQTE